MNRVPSLALLVLLAGCVNVTGNDYRAWALKETPSTFGQNEPWTVVMLNRDREIERTLTIEFSSDTAQTCNSEGWRKVRVLAESPERSGMFRGEPAYFVRGAALTIDLSANLCDAHYELQGELTEAGVTGTHGPVSPWGGEVRGDFIGIPTPGT
jgi:hypothetical protein